MEKKQQKNESRSLTTDWIDPLLSWQHTKHSHISQKETYVHPKVQRDTVTKGLPTI